MREEDTEIKIAVVHEWEGELWARKGGGIHWWRVKRVRLPQLARQWRVALGAEGLPSCFALKLGIVSLELWCHWQGAQLSLHLDCCFFSSSLVKVRS